ncbi:alpha/beta hydrolase family esterase [Sinimarinibacterium flocculans]|uniref:Poly(3-hydroxybutyrate) depolymerase n=1 Tax=Sinimarinibacterium flocculans TaxID=985250 RepID=A0A318ECU1_9GAMM|nr:PHB depolymerase family esterase [Sinimarinibacterium flocculans]PXV70291.1 poly(3-hydroxybutyrate) depolymerase [Sinimarinibacterium flocculans]
MTANLTRRLRRVPLMLVTLLLGACVAAPDVHAQQPGAASEHELRSGQLERSYRLYVPRSYDKSKPMPLLVALHGGLGTGKSMAEVSGFDRVAEARGLIVAYPDGIGRGWNAGSCCGKPMKNRVDDVGFMKNLIADVKRKVAIDDGRVYGAGFSNGAMLVHRVACEAPGTFTAIAAVAGGIMIKDCNTSKGTPTLLIQGRNDPRIPWNGGEFDGTYRPSIAEIVATLGKRNRCSGGETVVSEDDTVSCRKLGGCVDGNEVQWCGLRGVGHQWPGGKTLLPLLLGDNTNRYNASLRIVDFFLQHRR